MYQFSDFIKKLSQLSLLILCLNSSENDLWIIASIILTMVKIPPIIAQMCTKNRAKLSLSYLKLTVIGDSS